MQPEDLERFNVAKIWLQHASADLVLAQSELLPGGLYEHLCFHAQQAAEKAIKAVLIAHGTSFTFSHNLDTLISLLPDTVVGISEITNSVELTMYAVATRYPSQLEPVMEHDWLRSVVLARSVYQWAEITLADLNQE